MCGRWAGAGARVYWSKPVARRFLIAAVEALSRHEPFFTDSVPKELLDEYLARAGSHAGPQATDGQDNRSD